MSDHRKVLSATGIAFLALGVVALFVGTVSSWVNLTLPIASYGLSLGVGLALAGLGLIWANRADPDSLH